MTIKEKKELALLLDKHQIKSLFYSESCRKGGRYHILRLDDDEDHWVEDEINGLIEDE